MVRPGGSDSATFDNVLELLVLAGRSLPHALMMMIPEAWEGRDDLPDHVHDFYAFHSCLMEPWDGPAAVAFTDGRLIGATLDRNGLRPGRWQVTRDGFVVLASETGVLDVPPEDVVHKGRLQPGKLFHVDVEQGRIVEDGELKHEVAGQQPYGDWYRTRSCSSTTSTRSRRARWRPSRSTRASSCSATRRRTCGSRSPRWAGRRRRSRSARWATTSRWRCCPTAARCSTRTSSSSSRRSRTRRSTRSARSS